MPKISTPFGMVKLIVLEILELIITLPLLVARKPPVNYLFAATDRLDIFTGKSYGKERVIAGSDVHNDIILEEERSITESMVPPTGYNISYLPLLVRVVS